MAYNLTKLKDDIKEIVRSEIDGLRNGFKAELIGQIKIQIAESWDVLSGVVETKITAANIQMQNNIESFKKDAGEKLEYFSAILTTMNDIKGEVKEIKTQRETCLQNITRLQTQANGWEPRIRGNAKRINKLEDKPGAAALKAWMKILWIVAGAVIPFVLYGLYKLALLII
jgi:uncharacterized coiled-coil DUF342 family protein